MTSLMVTKIHEQLFESQVSPLSVLGIPNDSFCMSLDQTEENRTEYLLSILRMLDETDLMILITVYKNPNISAKRIGQLVNLSRYAALQRSKTKLSDKNCLMTYQAQPVGNVKPVYLFSIVPELTLELLEQVWNEVRKARGQPMVEDMDYTARALALQKLRPTSLLVLRLVAQGKNTSGLMRREVNISKAALHTHTTNLYEKTYLTREQGAGATSEFIYSVASWITLEMIEDAIIRTGAIQEITKKLRAEPRVAQSPQGLLVALGQLKANRLRVLYRISQKPGTTKREIQEDLSLPQSTAHTYISDLLNDALITRKSTGEGVFATHYYYLAEGLPRDAVVRAVAETGLLKQAQVDLNGHQDISSPSHQQSNSPHFSTLEARVVDNSDKTDASREERLTARFGSIDRVWEVLQALAEKIADHEERFAQLERSLSGGKTDPDEILAIIRARKS